MPEPFPAAVADWLGRTAPAIWGRTAPAADLQALLAFAVRAYAARRHAEPGVRLPPGGLTPTEVVVAVSDLLAAADVEAFEVDMWRSWGSTEPE